MLNSEKEHIIGLIEDFVYGFNPFISIDQNPAYIELTKLEEAKISEGVSSYLHYLNGSSENLDNSKERNGEKVIPARSPGVRIPNHIDEIARFCNSEHVPLIILLADWSTNCLEDTRLASLARRVMGDWITPDASQIIEDVLKFVRKYNQVDLLHMFDYVEDEDLRLHISKWILDSNNFEEEYYPYVLDTFALILKKWQWYPIKEPEMVFKILEVMQIDRSPGLLYICKSPEENLISYVFY